MTRSPNTEAERHCRERPLNREPRHIRIGGDIPFRELLICAAVVFAIGFGLAVV